MGKTVKKILKITNTLRINCNINDLNHPQKNLKACVFLCLKILIIVINLKQK